MVAVSTLCVGNGFLKQQFLDQTPTATSLQYFDFFNPYKNKFSSYNFQNNQKAA